MYRYCSTETVSVQALVSFTRICLPSECYDIIEMEREMNESHLFLRIKEHVQRVFSWFVLGIFSNNYVQLNPIVNYLIMLNYVTKSVTLRLNRLQNDKTLNFYNFPLSNRMNFKLWPEINCVSSYDSCKNQNLCLR